MNLLSDTMPLGVNYILMPVLLIFLLIFVSALVCMFMSFATNTSFGFNFFHVLQFHFGEKHRKNIGDVLSGANLSKLLDLTHRKTIEEVKLLESKKETQCLDQCESCKESKEKSIDENKDEMKQNEKSVSVRNEKPINVRNEKSINMRNEESINLRNEKSNDDSSKEEIEITRMENVQDKKDLSLPGKSRNESGLKRRIKEGKSDENINVDEVEEVSGNSIESQVPQEKTLEDFLTDVNVYNILVYTIIVLCIIYIVILL